MGLRTSVISDVKGNCKDGIVATLLIFICPIVRLIDSNLRDDVKCAKKIFKVHGFSAW